MKEGLIKISLVIGSLLFVFFALEAGLRIINGEYRFINFLGEERTLFKSVYPTRYDSNFGWIPREGKNPTDTRWGTTITILEHGIRSNGETDEGLLRKPPILAVGDSFTFGDEVSDSETWPAQLEKKIGRPVINGGVFGYGLDQSFLRAMHLAEIFQPDTLILSLIPEDIERCELCGRAAAWKPYFDISKGRLVLKNIPAPEPFHPSHLGTFREFLGRSYLCHWLMMRCCPHWWLMGVTWKAYLSSYRIHDKGEAVACKILQELDRMAKRTKIDRVLVLIQYWKFQEPEELAMISRLKRQCIDPERIEILDLYEPLQAVRRRSPEGYKRLFNHHMTVEGNAFVADQLAAALSRQ